METSYGFEYLGASYREVSNSATERATLGLLQAVQAFSAGLCVGPAVSVNKRHTRNKISFYFVLYF